MISLTVLTCTGDRPEAFDLAERWMLRQTLQPARWVVVDDGQVPQMPMCWQDHLTVPPMAGHSLRRNVTEGLRWIAENPLGGLEAVVFWEDDDYYAPWWLERVQDLLTRRDPWQTSPAPMIVGEAAALYYNVQRRRVARYNNMHHASLAMTAIRAELIPAVLNGPPLAEGQEQALIDWRLWQMDVPRKLYLPESQERPSVVGMKAMPGRRGIAGGHSDQDISGWIGDSDLAMLRLAIGGDVLRYAEFYQPAEQPPEQSAKQVVEQVVEQPAEQVTQIV
jgi:hypothetical protein